VPREGAQLTGVSDNAYNLTSVLYHAAQGETQYAKYIEDAEAEGDQELADFFREVQQQDADRAKRARVLLMDRQ
jgi:rubrerythrin